MGLGWGWIGAVASLSVLAPFWGYVMMDYPKKIKLTKTFITGLPTPSKRVRIKDETQSGLILRLEASGARAFYLRRLWKGRRVERKIGVFGIWTVDQARTRAAEMNTALNLGDDPARQVDRKQTMQGLYKQFELFFRGLVERGMKSEQTRYNRNSIWCNHIEPRIGSHKMQHFDEAEARLLLIDIKNDCSPSIHNHAHGLLTSMFNYAIDELQLGLSHPIKGIKTLPTRHRDRFLKADEFAAFFRSVQMEAQIYQDLVYSFILTGQRKTTVVSMEWAELDIERALWVIPASKMKSSRPHSVPLVDDMLDILARRRQDRQPDEHWVFPSETTPGAHVSRGMGAGTYWRRIITRAGLWDDVDKQKRLTIHDLRRTLGSWQAMEGVGLLQIAKTLAHNDIKTTHKTYAHLLDDGARSGMQKAATAITRRRDAEIAKQPSSKLDQILGDVDGLSQDERMELLRRLVK